MREIRTTSNSEALTRARGLETETVGVQYTAGPTQHRTVCKCSCPQPVPLNEASLAEGNDTKERLSCPDVNALLIANLIATIDRLRIAVGAFQLELTGLSDRMRELERRYSGDGVNTVGG